ncbi:hypothetical protein COM16_28565 [Bacillus toyonensis]|nr:hypothetical protein COM16_28565 [Bacillus toyonensis]
MSIGFDKYFSYSIKGCDCGANTGRKMIKLFIKNYSLATNNPSILIKLFQNVWVSSVEKSIFVACF